MLCGSQVFFFLGKERVVFWGQLFNITIPVIEVIRIRTNYIERYTYIHVRVCTFYLTQRDSVS